jgi:hypothetical protein
MDICSFKNTFLTGDKGLASSFVFLSSQSSSAEGGQCEPVGEFVF